MDDLSGRRLFWSTAVFLIELAALYVADDEVFGVGDQQSDWVYLVVWPPTTIAFIGLGCFVAVTLVWPAGLFGTSRLRGRPQARRGTICLLALSLASGVAALYAWALPGDGVESWAEWGGLTLASAWPLLIFIAPARPADAEI